MQWEALYQDECIQQATQNANQSNTIWDYDALFRQGNWSIVIQQAGLLPGYYDQVCHCALQAWDQISPYSRPPSDSSLILLRQRPDDPISVFILRARVSLERKITYPGARDILLWNIVWEGMTSECHHACAG